MVSALPVLGTGKTDYVRCAEAGGGGNGRIALILTITRIDNHSQLGDKGEQSWQLSFMIVCVCNRLNEDRVRSAILTGGLAAPKMVYARCGGEKELRPMPGNNRINMLEKEPAALASAA